LFDDRLIIAAGELWTLKDHADDLEAIILASNSGHFKPDYSALHNTLPGLERLGIPKERVILFGGPNNTKSIFKEIEEIHGIKGLKGRLCPGSDTLLREWMKNASSLLEH